MMETVMNEYNKGYSAYVNGVEFDDTKSNAWQNGWEAAQADDDSCADEAMERDGEAYAEMELLREEP
jgi:hypothetical protein